VAHHDVASVLENIAKHAGQMLDTEHVFNALVAPDETHFESKISLGALRSAANVQLKRGEGIAGVIWQTGQPLLVDDYDTWRPRSGTFARNVIRSVIGVPLITKEIIHKLRGFITVDSQPNHGAAFTILLQTVSS